MFSCSALVPFNPEAAQHSYRRREMVLPLSQEASVCLYITNLLAEEQLK